jgi:hypothetical protein
LPDHDKTLAGPEVAPHDQFVVRLQQLAAIFADPPNGQKNMQMIML